MRRNYANHPRFRALPKQNPTSSEDATTSLRTMFTGFSSNSKAKGGTVKSMSLRQNHLRTSSQIAAP